MLIVPRGAALFAGALVVGVVAVVLVAVFVARPSDPEPFRLLEPVEARVGGQSLRIVIAQDHATGLMGVSDLGDIDGMLFTYASEVDPARHRFWMQGVLIPLDIAFFDGDGGLVSQLSMPLCSETDQATGSCPLHAAAGPFRWALETEAGSFRFDPGARLELPG